MRDDGAIDADQATLSTDAAGLLTLSRMVSRLKAVPRAGWLDRGIDRSEAESVADHSFGVALLAWAAAVERQQAGLALNPERVLLLALVHDLAEAAIGDRPPYDQSEMPASTDREARREFLDRRHIRSPANAKAKQLAEDAAMRELLNSIPQDAGEVLDSLWSELKSGTSAEAKFVKQVDRLETFLQSRYYRATDSSLPIGSFEREVRETIDDPLLQAIRDIALAGELD